MRLVKVLLVVLTSTPQLYADPIFRFYRSPRALGMGGTTLATADDESALFANPAGLAHGKILKSIDIIDLQIEITQYSKDVILDLIDVSEKEEGEIKDAFWDMSEKYAGRTIGVSMRMFPNIVFKFFGVGLLAEIFDVRGRFSVPSIPEASLEEFTIIRFIPIGGAGISLLGDYLNIGVSVKGLIELVDTSTSISALYALRNVNHPNARKLEDNPFLEIKRTCGYKAGNLPLQTCEFAGIDSGIFYTFKKFRQKPQIGLVIKNISYKMMTISLGASIKPKFGPVKTIFGAELEDILFQRSPDKDLMKRIHIGAEFKLPVLSARFGFNQTYLTMGLGINLWIFEINLATYAEELGSGAGAIPERRYLVSLTL